MAFKQCPFQGKNFYSLISLKTCFQGLHVNAMNVYVVLLPSLFSGLECEFFLYNVTQENGEF